jgi:hypothetical protein
MRSEFQKSRHGEGTFAWVLRRSSFGIVAIIGGFSALCWLSAPEAILSPEPTEPDPLAHVEEGFEAPVAPAVNQTLPDILFTPPPMEEWRDDIDVDNVG